jgi:hypothetical protein
VNLGGLNRAALVQFAFRGVRPIRLWRLGATPDSARVVLARTAKAGRATTIRSVRSTYIRVLIVQTVVLLGLWILQQAFL